MSENKFERHIQSKLQPAEIAPREELWSLIEARIAPSRRRPLAGFWWFGGLAGLLALSGWGLLKMDLGPSPESLPTLLAPSAEFEAAAPAQQAGHQEASILETPESALVPSHPARPREPEHTTSSGSPTYISEVLPASTYMGFPTAISPNLTQQLTPQNAPVTTHEAIKEEKTHATLRTALAPLPSLPASDYDLSPALTQLTPLPAFQSYQSGSWWVGLHANQANMGRVISETFQSAPLLSSQLDGSLGESRFVLPEAPTYSQTLTFPKTSQAVHVSVLHQFNRYLGLQAGLGYQMASGGIFTQQEVPSDVRPQGNFPVSQSNLTIIETASFSEKSIEIPVALRTRLPIGRAALVLTTGASLNLAQQRQISLASTQLEDPGSQPQLNARYSHANASLAIQWQLAPHFQVEAGPTASYYLSNAYQHVTAAPRYRAGMQVGVWYRLP